MRFNLSSVTNPTYMINKYLFSKTTAFSPSNNKNCGPIMLAGAENGRPGQHYY